MHVWRSARSDANRLVRILKYVVLNCRGFGLCLELQLRPPSSAGSGTVGQVQ